MQALVDDNSIVPVPLDDEDDVPQNTAPVQPIAITETASTSTSNTFALDLDREDDATRDSDSDDEDDGDGDEDHDHDHDHDEADDDEEEEHEEAVVADVKVSERTILCFKSYNACFPTRSMLTTPPFSSKTPTMHCGFSCATVPRRTNAKTPWYGS